MSFLKMLKNVNISERKCHYDNNNNISEYFFSLQAQLLHILNRWTNKIKIALFFVMLWGFFWTYPPKPHLLTLSHIHFNIFPNLNYPNIFSQWRRLNSKVILDAKHTQKTHMWPTICEIRPYSTWPPIISTLPPP